jgi:hypothetical protein
VIFLLNGIGTLAMVAARGANGPAAMLAGTAITLAALQTASEAVFLTGTAVAGAGFGTAMLCTFRTISALAAPGQRAGLIAAYFIASYLHRVQRPRRGRRDRHHPCRPAPHRPGLLHRDRRPRRGGSGQPDLPSPLYRPELTVTKTGSVSSLRGRVA